MELVECLVLARGDALHQRLITRFQTKSDCTGIFARHERSKHRIFDVENAATAFRCARRGCFGDARKAVSSERKLRPTNPRSGHSLLIPCTSATHSFWL